MGFKLPGSGIPETGTGVSRCYQLMVVRGLDELEVRALRLPS